METESVWHQPTFYIAVMVYESAADAPDYESLYEESFVLIKASSEAEAKEKALRQAREPFSYKNEYDETITWSFKQLVAVLSMVQDAFNDGTELFARHFRNYKAYRLNFLKPL